MVFLKVRGVDVEFPFEPYACQRSYMEKVIQCLQEGTNGVLESPTGTGKTLCLLCATLAWRSAYVAKMQFEGLKQQFTKDEDGQSTYGELLANQLGGAAGWGNTEQAAGPFMEIPKIIYASRTHSQLSQAVAELKNTSYSNLKVCILGSREQLCIHPEVQEQTNNSTKVHMCKAKTSSRLCTFYNNLDEKKSEKEFTEAPLDIEDLVKVGKKHKVCPYFMARELKSSADIIFMPYNYLLDPKSRKAHSVDLKSHIVVFDEAHNLEKMCEESSSFDLTSYDLASCVEELDNLHKSVAEIEVLNEKFHTESSTPPDFSATELIKLKSMLLELEKKIDSLPLPANGTGLTRPGSFIYELFAELQITFDTAPILLEVLDKVVAYATTNTGTSVVFGNKAAGVSKLGDVLKIAFSHDSSASQKGSNLANLMAKYYKVYVKTEEGFQKKSKANADPWATTSSSKPKKQGRTLSYWCFSPGHAMQDLANHGVRSIILTSGTLSPLESFTAEMHIDFPVHLENPHVIERHQVWLGMVTKGPDGVRLNSSYENRNSTDYINSLGNAIVNFARIVPNGLLVFFPSYPVMNKCLEVWQDSGVSNRISQYKTMVVEPRGKTQFVEAMEQFYEKINDPTLNGAAFFAVCRGKVSEGLDFADINGRAVVITGLPFPPRMDPKVMLKMSFLDEGKTASKGLTGRQWYRQQASRAVNQAIGRVIRHRQDYGAILLCDHRFTYADARAQLPSWVRPYATTYNTFGQAIKDLISFFKTADRTLPQPVAKNKTSVPVMTASFQPSRSHVMTGAAGSSCRNSCQEARRIDSHVPSLRRSPEPKSFAHLKVGYETYGPVKQAQRPVSSTGLFDALQEVEDRKEEDGEDEAWTDFLTSQDSSSSGRPVAKPVMRKRIKIVKWEDRGKHNIEPQKAQPSDKPVKKPMLMSAEKYLAEVRRVLSIEKFKLFQKMLGDYKKTDDFNAMVTNLADLLTEDDSTIHLFREFYKFVRPHHKKQFDQTCKDITGQGCGYKPEHSVSRKCLQEHKDSAHVTKKRRLNTGGAESSTAGMSASGGTSQLDSTTHLNKGGKHLGSSSAQSAPTSLSSWLQGGNTSKTSASAPSGTQENSAISQSGGASAAVSSATCRKEVSNEKQRNFDLTGSYNDLRNGLQVTDSGLSNSASSEMGGLLDEEERRMNALFDEEDAE
ncbi:regulator of telomere elongation helicase 1-like isoform X1 [Branchiostoma floridae]|uniref:Regulator of telomere elongation helicase 1 homolog n=1 Tax=Branchiostoma floridae TaxID=7739 RepID=A0A9J7HVW0_BRAFL|nr:regulator of telomere elongation helicase 1-like isoform X1 [Branchiostoma floridae]